MSAPSCGCGAERSVNSSGAGANAGLAAAACQPAEQCGTRSAHATCTMASSQGTNELKFADWMATLPESIHSIPLTNLAIPGRAHGARRRHLPRPAEPPLGAKLPRCPREGHWSQGWVWGQASAAGEPPASWPFPNLWGPWRGGQGDCFPAGLLKQAVAEGWGGEGLGCGLAPGAPSLVFLRRLGGGGRIWVCGGPCAVSGAGVLRAPSSAWTSDSIPGTDSRGFGRFLR